MNIKNNIDQNLGSLTKLEQTAIKENDVEGLKKAIEARKQMRASIINFFKEKYVKEKYILQIGTKLIHDCSRIEQILIELIDEIVNDAQE